MLDSLNIIAAPIFVLVGSYAPADSAGISVYKLDAELTDAELVASLSGVSNPSFQAINKDGSVIYSVAEDSGSTSAAVAISYDRKSHQLSVINSEPTRGGAPCYIAVAPDGNHVVTANYLGGSFSVFPLADNGALGSPELFAFEGSGPVSGRQTQPHVHCISFTPDSALLLATDLGTDRIHTYTLGGDSLIDRASRQDLALNPGSGPRHIVWNNSGDKAYLINELSGMVTVLDYDGKTLSPVQYELADTLNAAGSGDIHLSRDGRFLYASNRLKGDGLAIFSVDPESGLINKVGYQPTGPHPRNFLITPDDRYVLVACRDNNSIEIYSRDIATGLLTPTGRKINTPRPVCLTLLPADE